MVDGQCINLGLWDTAGQEDFDRLRPLSYNNTDVFLVCFSVMSRVSMQNAEAKWIPELRLLAPGSRIVLVGLQVDLRGDHDVVQALKSRGLQPCSYDDGVALGELVDAPYVECSALTQRGLKQVFDLAIRVALAEKNKRAAKRRSPSRWMLNHLTCGRAGLVA